MTDHSLLLTTVEVRFLAQQDYAACWQAMKSFTDQRDETTPDQIWVVEHAPVYTQGQNGKPEHILNPETIPVVQTDRGGQVTYHGPGQLVAYVLVDLKRKKFNVRELVTHLEQSVIALLADFQISAYSDCKAPGVYVDQQKICSVGLRIRRGCSYHGLALNVDVDLEPFERINPCGFEGLKMVRMVDLYPDLSRDSIGMKLTEHLTKKLGYTNVLL